MNDLFRPDVDTNGSEPLDEGGTWLLDLVSAVDHLRRGYRPGFTVWNALDEALDWATSANDDASAADDLPEVLTARPDGHQVLHRAIRDWVLIMADMYNSGHHWPHPAQRRTYPPPRLDAE
ncbi:MAG: hypothetical protein KDB26_13110 [Microthrixaceae bacterium]|nr:hypothetical protein [Microthrixaceae bacterium]